MLDVRTPDWRSLTREQFAARVWQLVPEANKGKPLPILTREEEEHAWKLIDGALEFEVGPYDTACQIVDDWWDAHH